MIRVAAVTALLATLGMTAGCVSTVVSGVVDVATAPVRIVGAGVNAVAPGQKERDRRRGKRERKAEQKARREAKQAAKSAA